MFTAYTLTQGRLTGTGHNSETVPEGAVWIDLYEPTRAEETMVEGALGLSVPTRADMDEIEASSRLYLEDGAAFMTALLPARTDGDDPVMAPVTFVLSATALITVRYHEPRAFTTFIARAQRADIGCTDAETILIALLETVVDRLADVLERAGGEIDTLARSVFQTSGNGPRNRPDFNAVLQEIGRKGDLNSKIRDSLATLDRLAGFLSHVGTQRKVSKDVRDRVKTLARDVRSLADHGNFLSQKINFLLDATLGMINIEQNGIIKIFSVAAVIFLPPTLIASIYGMNFTLMPELDWRFGYPFAIGLMLLSAGSTIAYFKRRGWL